ncbi:MAG: hypothetical protein AAF206_09370 [Bacteroidota bacterium]
MQRISIIIILIFSALILNLRAERHEQDPLHRYLQSIRGTWISIEGEGVISQAELLVHVSPQKIYKGQAAIAVSRYYQEALADELLFRLDGRHLRLSGGLRKGKRVSMVRLEFASIWWEKEGQDSILYFEACEMEHQDYTFKALRRIKDYQAHLNTWPCALQAPFTAFLRLGKYRIEQANGQPISLAEALQTEAPLDELVCIEEYTGLWPMYEEDCSCSEYPLVLLGSLHPGGSAAFFIIDWQEDRILLYKSLRDAENGRLQKGPLVLSIRPAFAPIIYIPSNIRS